MKTPFPAYFLEPERNPALPCVSVRPCLVVALLAAANPPSAIIHLHSLTEAGWVSKLVPYSALCSDLGKAVDRVAEKIKLLPELNEITADPELAGVIAGKNLS